MFVDVRWVGFLPPQKSFITLGPGRGQFPVVSQVTGEAVEELEAGLGLDPLVVEDGQREVGVAPQRQHFIYNRSNKLECYITVG
jgi:hypothetical protein